MQYINLLEILLEIKVQSTSFISSWYTSDRTPQISLRFGVGISSIKSNQIS